MEPDGNRALESISRIRHLLAEWLRSTDESRQPVAEILTLLESVDTFIRAKSGGSSGETRDSRAGARGNRGTTYSIEKKRNEVETLTEHRQGGASQPYRVPKHIYEATVNVLAEPRTSLDFGQIVKGMAVAVPEPPEWQVRAVLRFLMNLTPPLVVRERNKYRPLVPRKIVAEARSAWQSLASASR